MKIQIRRGVFETNSSSVHALVLPVDKSFEDVVKQNKGRHIHVSGDEYEWNSDSYGDWDSEYFSMADYIWTVFVKSSKTIEEVNERVGRMMDVCKKYGVTISFEYPFCAMVKHKYCDCYSVEMYKKTNRHKVAFDGCIHLMDEDYFTDLWELSDEDLFRLIVDPGTRMVITRDSHMENIDAYVYAPDKYKTIVEY